MTSKINKVAVVGTGGIGGSWVAYFLSRGLDVVAIDPAPGEEADLRKRVDLAWESLKDDLVPGASRARLTFNANLDEAVADVDFVQENTPERIEIKHDIFRRMDAASRPDTLLVSSSSSLLVTDMQSTCKHPERVVLGHPFNPPHIIPLVEVVGGKKTSEDAIARTIAFYREIGRKPIRLKKEIFGHVANRLQSALWREAFHLVVDGVISAEDLDLAITEGPGVRYAVQGPFITFHVAGRDGGFAATLKHMGPPTEAMMAALTTRPFTDEDRKALVDAAKEMVGDREIESLTRYRNNALSQIVKAKKAAESFKG